MLLRDSRGHADSRPNVRDCQHNTQHRYGSIMWCCHCGAIKGENREWQLPARPPAIVSDGNVIERLQRISRNTSENYREDAAEALALLGAET